MVKRVVKQVRKDNSVNNKSSKNYDKLYAKAIELKEEDKKIRESMNEWVDGRGNVINKYIYSEKWKYHLKLRGKMFNFLKGLVREEQEFIAKKLNVSINSKDNERDIIKKMLVFLIN